MIRKGSWVQIHKIVLTPNERAPQVPEDTKKVPLELWVKGFLLDDSEIGNIVKIKTITGRIEEGNLIKVNPRFNHDYGDFVSEILEVGQIVKEVMYGVDLNE